MGTSGQVLQYYPTGKNDDFPWSATFISYIMRKAGSGDRFKFSTQHSVYIREAIKAREKGNKKYGFWGFRLSERALEVGDLVCYARESGISFDTQSANYKSHTAMIPRRSESHASTAGHGTRAAPACDRPFHITPADVPECPLFCQHYETFSAMVQTEVFTLRLGQQRFDLAAIGHW